MQSNNSSAINSPFMKVVMFGSCYDNLEAAADLQKSISL